MAKNKNSIAKNTIMLYSQMFITLLISLYTSRVVLNVLGVDDFGIYNVVGGFIMMFAFLNNAMATASARFIAYEQGRDDANKQRLIFTTSCIIHFLIAVLIATISETFGLWFVSSKMVIPASRAIATLWVFHMAVLSFFINIITVPLISSVIAHEKMSIYSIVNIIDAILKLVIVYLITRTSYDNLILYSILLCVVSFVNLLIYTIYCKVSFKECRFEYKFDVSLMRKMISFAGWSFVGNFGISAKDYGVNVVLNMFCGPAINAARGIALQVSTAINGFVANFQTAVTPQITKRYAKNEIKSMIMLMQRASKLSFYLLSIIVVPVILRADCILDIWLVDVPDYTVIFLRLILLMNLINSMYGPISTAMLATGRIKTYQTVVAIIMFSDVPVSYFALWIGLPPYIVLIVGITSAFIALIGRVALLNKEVEINIRDFYRLIFKNMVVFVIMLIPSFFLNQIIPYSLVGLILVTLVSVISSVLIVYIFGLDTDEREYGMKMIRNFISKFEKKWKVPILLLI